MSYIVFDSAAHKQLLPFTHTRPVGDIRCGILTMRERWELVLNTTTSTITQPYLSTLFPSDDAQDNIYINGAVFATEHLANIVDKLLPNQALVANGNVIAARLKGFDGNVDALNDLLPSLTAETYTGEVIALNNIWDIFSLNDKAIAADYTLFTKGKTSQPIPAGVTVTGAENLFIEEGAKIYAGCIINAATGPVYIGTDAEILEGTLIRGPFAACEHSVVKMGAKIYGATTIGPGSKVGGEINNAVFFANSNKSHDGYLGNAVIGEWCNLGADTNASNLKNNYGEVKVWQEATGKEISTGLIFCGLLMADHSKCGINTMFNTGTVVGVSCNIYGGGFPDKHIPSFSWGGSDGFVPYTFDKAIETMSRVFARRGRVLSENEIKMYRYIYDSSYAINK